MIQLTEKTRILHRQYQEVSQEMTELFYRDFTTQDIDEFEGFLNRLLTNLIEAQ